MHDAEHSTAPSPQPVARYFVEDIDGCAWLVRLGPQGHKPVSQYINEEFAWKAADHLNTLVQWEVS